MIGLGYTYDILANIINMSSFAWFCIAVLVGVVIYWLVDWQNQHEDGE